MPLIAGQEKLAIVCNRGFGPVFGTGIAHDLCIANAPNSNNCSSTLNSAYQCPAGQHADTFLTGKNNFTLSELEVFGFDIKQES